MLNKYVGEVYVARQLHYLKSQSITILHTNLLAHKKLTYTTIFVQQKSSPIFKQSTSYNYGNLYIE